MQKSDVVDHDKIGIIDVLLLARRQMSSCAVLQPQVLISLAHSSPAHLCRDSNVFILSSLSLLSSRELMGGRLCRLIGECDGDGQPDN